MLASMLMLGLFGLACRWARAARVCARARRRQIDPAKYIDFSVSADDGSPTLVSEHPASQPVRRQ
jgi:hypothetical protein